MSYKKQDFVPKQKLSADHLNNIEDGIVNNENAINEKQDKLVSGTNIKTINGESILGEGNISIAASSGSSSGSDVGGECYCIKNAVFYGDSITHGVYSYFNPDKNNQRENGFDTTDNTHLRIPAHFGVLSGANVTNHGKRGSGWVQDTRGLGNGLEMSRLTNFADYDFAAYCLGINDWIQGAALGTFTDDPAEAAAAAVEVMMVSDEEEFVAPMTFSISRSATLPATDTTIEVQEGETVTNPPIETTVVQGFASSEINNTQANRARTGYIQPPYYIEVNPEYRIRAIYSYPSPNYTTSGNATVKSTSTTATSYEIPDDGKYHIITFAMADANANIDPTADIIKSLYRPGEYTTDKVVTVTGGTIEGREPVITELTQGAGACSNTGTPDILTYNSMTNRVRTEFVEAPFYIEVNDGYVIHGITKYSDNDYTSGKASSVINASLGNHRIPSYTQSEIDTEYPYWIITFTKTDNSQDIAPEESIIKKFYILTEEDGVVEPVEPEPPASDGTIIGGIAPGYNSSITTRLVNGAGSVTASGAPDITQYNGRTTRLRTEFIQAPFYVEANSGYTIRAVAKYSNNDYTSGTAKTLTTTTKNASFTVAEADPNYPYYIITFTNQTDTTTITPTELVVKYLCSPEEPEVLEGIEVTGAAKDNGTPIKTRLTQGAGVIGGVIPDYDGDPTRVRTVFIRPPYYVETNEGYVIRSIVKSKEKDYTCEDSLYIDSGVFDRTSYFVNPDGYYPYHIITFTKVNDEEEIAPEENIIKYLYVPESIGVEVTGNVKDEENDEEEGTPITTRLINGEGKVENNKSKISSYDGNPTRIRTMFVQAPYFISVNEGYVIRTIIGCKTNNYDDAVSNNAVYVNEQSITEYEAETNSAYPYHIITFAKTDDTEDITPEENIINYFYEIPFNEDDILNEDGTIGQGNFVGPVRGNEGAGIRTNLVNGAGSVSSSGTPAITQYDGNTARLRTEFIQAPFYVEANNGYTIRAVAAYSDNDYTSGTAKTLTTTTKNVSFTVAEVDPNYPYYIITFTNQTDTAKITPTENVVKYLYAPGIGGGESSDPESPEVPDIPDIPEEEPEDTENFDPVEFVGGTVEGCDAITTVLSSGLGSVKNGFPDITDFDGVTTRVRTDFIQAPFHIEVNSGYTIRAIVGYSYNDYTNGIAKTIFSYATNPTLMRYDMTEKESTYAYYIITFARKDNSALNISPSEDIVKYLYIPNEEEEEDANENTGGNVDSGNTENKEEIIYGESVDIVGAVKEDKGISTTLSRGYGSNTINSSQKNRIRTGFIKPPYYIEVNEGYVIRAIYSYSTADESATGTVVKNTSTTATSYEVTGNGYHIITFADASDANKEITPNTGIIKYLYPTSSGSSSGGGSGTTIAGSGHIPVPKEGTVIGNMCLCFQQIAEQNPLCKVVVYSPYNAWGQVSFGGDYTSNTLYGDESTNYALGTTNRAGYTLQDLIDVIDKVCKYYGIHHVPLSQSNVCNRLTIKNIMIDGLHPSRESRKFLAAEIFGKKGFDK